MQLDAEPGSDLTSQVRTRLPDWGLHQKGQDLRGDLHRTATAGALVEQSGHTGSFERRAHQLQLTVVLADSSPVAGRTASAGRCR